MSRPTAHRRDERGALSSTVLLAAGALVLLALLYYVVTLGGSSSTVASPEPTSSGTPTPSVTAPPPSSSSSSSTGTVAPSATSPTGAAPIRRSSVRVGVYNNSTISGLASRTAARVTKLGWNVVTVSNWSGQISATTVYYPAGYRAAAQLLADDLGVTRIHRATATMPTRSLTLILTGSLG